MKKEYKKIVPTKNQINFFNNQRRNGESLYECALRLMGDSHRKLSSQKKEISSPHFKDLKISSFLGGDSHPCRIRKTRITIIIEEVA